MDYRFVLIATSSIACASTGPAPIFDGEAAVLEVEDSLREAEVAVDAGDTKKARELIAQSEVRIQQELGAQPDRHQLLAHAAELRDRLNGRKPIVTTSAVAKAPSEDSRPSTLDSRLSHEDSRLDHEDSRLHQDEDPSLTNSASRLDLDAAAAFKDGPLLDRKNGLKKLASAKRAPKKKKSRLYAEARALLESCANEGGRMVVSSPDLQTKSFTVGAKKRTADWIVVQCKSKIRSIDRRLKKKFRQS